MFETRGGEKGFWGRYDIQHNDTQHNDTQHNDTQLKDTQHKNTQLKNIRHNGTKRKALVNETDHK